MSIDWSGMCEGCKARTIAMKKHIARITGQVWNEPRQASNKSAQHKQQGVEGPKAKGTRKRRVSVPSVSKDSDG